MRPEAETDQRVPLRYDAEGLPVFEDWDDSPTTEDPEKAAFEAKVAAYKAQIENHRREEPSSPHEASEDVISKLVDASDAAVAEREKRQGKPRSVHPAAPVRKTGKQPQKLLGTIGDIPVFSDPAVPVGQPIMVAVPEEDPPAPVVPPYDRPRRKRKLKAVGADDKPVLGPTSRQIEDISDEDLLREAGVVPVYSTTEAAQFFDRTNQWLYWGLGRDEEGHAPIFVHPDGTPITPEWIGEVGVGRRRFTLPIIKDILLSSYRRGNIEPEELKRILRRIRINELGGEWREREGWVKVRGKWVHPDKAEQVNGTWKRKKETQ